MRRKFGGARHLPLLGGAVLASCVSELTSAGRSQHAKTSSSPPSAVKGTSRSGCDARGTDLDEPSTGIAAIREATDEPGEVRSEGADVAATSANDFSLPSPIPQSRKCSSAQGPPVPVPPMGALDPSAPVLRGPAGDALAV
eukprot:scaffold133183_cov30-Tisochrysis_lutea.AAC.9